MDEVSYGITQNSELTVAAVLRANVGIAMGGSGVDVALESADIVLVKDELIQVPYLIKLSQKTVRVAKQNIAASLGLKLILGALGLMGFIPHVVHCRRRR